MPRGIGSRELQFLGIATTNTNPSEADTSHQDPVSTTKSTQELAEKRLDEYVPEKLTWSATSDSIRALQFQSQGHDPPDLERQRRVSIST
jgi:hypothetical protein